MPCRDGRDEPGYTHIEYRDSPEQEKRIREREAMLCAILNELKERNIVEEVISMAEHKGKIKITPFWEEHQKEDIARLKKQMNKYSEHEIRLIKKILNKQL